MRSADFRIYPGARFLAKLDFNMYLHKSGLWAAYLNGRTVYLDKDHDAAKEALAYLTGGQFTSSMVADWNYLVNHWLFAELESGRS